MSPVSLPFSDQARAAVSRAESIAARFNQTNLEPEHLLLGLTQGKNNRAIHLLTQLSISTRLLQKPLEQYLALQQSSARREVQFTQRSQQVFALAEETATQTGSRFIGTDHLLFGLLREGQGAAYTTLRNYGAELSTLNATATRTINLPAEDVPDADLAARETPLRPSLIFLLILIGTIAAGVYLYTQEKSLPLVVSLFVTGGWIVSLSLHEFGHALVAYLAGDSSVRGKGYLTLNPLKYTHPLVSIVLPLIILALGGIGLPGGAVYIQRDRIKGRNWLSLVSAAGPLATLCFALFLGSPFFLGLVSPGTVQAHGSFWAGLAFLILLEVTALVFNLLPIPGLDGFGILAPWLPSGVRRQVMVVGQYSFWIVLIALWYVDSVNRLFWSTVFQLTQLLGVSPDLVVAGFQLFRFWQ